MLMDKPVGGRFGSSLQAGHSAGRLKYFLFYISQLPPRPIPCSFPRPSPLPFPFPIPIHSHSYPFYNFFFLFFFLISFFASHFRFYFRWEIGFLLDLRRVRMAIAVVGSRWNCYI